MKHICYLALAVLGFPTFLCHAQSCTLSYGAQVPQGAIECIQAGTTSGPTQPPLYATGLGGECDYNSAQLNTTWTESASAAQPYFHATNGLFGGNQVAGGVVSYIDWNANIYVNTPQGANSFEGGNASMSIFEDGQQHAISTFTIEGVNPSTSLLASTLQAMEAPWYYGRTLTRESSNLQFNSGSAYSPVWGTPDGFGLTQIDASSSTSGNAYYSKLTDDSLWSWQQNLAEGVGIAESNQSPAYAWLTQQNSQAAAVGISAPFYSVTYGNCDAMEWSGSGRNGIQDAEWITEYNGGHYATFNQGSNTWTIRNAYALATCNSNSATIPN